MLSLSIQKKNSLENTVDASNIWFIQYLFQKYIPTINVIRLMMHPQTLQIPLEVHIY